MSEWTGIWKKYDGIVKAYDYKTGKRRKFMIINEMFANQFCSNKGSGDRHRD